MSNWAKTITETYLTEKAPPKVVLEKATRELVKLSGLLTKIVTLMQKIDRDPHVGETINHIHAAESELADARLAILKQMEIIKKGPVDWASPNPKRPIPKRR